MTDKRRIIETMLEQLDPPDPEQVKAYVRANSDTGPFVNGFELSLMAPIMKDGSITMKCVGKVFKHAGDIPAWAEIWEGCEHLKLRRGGILRPQ